MARGVDGEVIVDKAPARVSKSGSRYAGAACLAKCRHSGLGRTKVAVAHNEVMAIALAAEYPGTITAPLTGTATNC
jgi:hypothetical protein